MGIGWNESGGKAEVGGGLGMEVEDLVQAVYFWYVVLFDKSVLLLVYCMLFSPSALAAHSWRQ